MGNTTEKLRFGLWYAFRNPEQWRQPYQDLYREILDQIVWAEGLGYHDVWLTEHHFTPDGHAPSPLPLAAAIAAKTEKIRIGTGVMLLPLYNPVRVAEDAATIDILSDGRFELGIGLGYRTEEFSGLGIPRNQRGSRANESLEIIRRLWGGETVTYKGRHFDIEAAKIAPRPIQTPHPPIWVGGFSKAAALRAARLGDGFIGTGNMGEMAEVYQDELRRLGKEAEKPNLAGGHFWLVVSEDPDSTWADLSPHVLYQVNLYAKWLKAAGQDLFPFFQDSKAMKASGILQVVTPAKAIELITDYVNKVPIRRYYTWTIPPGFPVAKMNKHIELFATKVIPHFS